MNNPVILTAVIGALGAILAATISSITTINISKRKKRLQQENKYKLIQERIQLDSEIHGALGRLLGITNADRAYIYQFHPDNTPMYFSCAYEEVRDGISLESDNRQNLLLSYHSNLLKRIQDKNLLCCSIDIICSEHIGLLLKCQGVKTTCMYPIENQLGYMIGFIGLDYVEDKPSIECDIHTILSNFTFKISSKLISYEN